MSLQGRVCIVTGASRGIGKGIAVQLGEEGAIVYVTGRTLKKKDGTIGSLEETAEEISQRGGTGIPVQCDHKKQDDVQRLFDRVKKEQQGRLDLLVNNAYSAVSALLASFGKKFYEIPADVWDEVNDVGLRNHYYCSWHAVQLMKPRNEGLIVMISSGGGLRYLFNVAYGVGKAGCDRMAVDMAFELRKTGISCLSLWPGAVLTEQMSRMMDQAKQGQVPGMQEKQSQLLIQAFENGETVEFTGKVVAALLKDKKLEKKSGRVHIVADLADSYGIQDIDGTWPLSMRSIKSLLELSAIPLISWFIPRWLKIPCWIITLFGGKL